MSFIVSSMCLDRIISALFISAISGSSWSLRSCELRDTIIISFNSRRCARMFKMCPNARRSQSATVFWQYLSILSNSLSTFSKLKPIWVGKDEGGVVRLYEGDKDDLAHSWIPVFKFSWIGEVCKWEWLKRPIYNILRLTKHNIFMPDNESSLFI
jgi:hypothetical protein